MGVDLKRTQHERGEQRLGEFFTDRRTRVAFWGIAGAPLVQLLSRSRRVSVCAAPWFLVAIN